MDFTQTAFLILHSGPILAPWSTKIKKSGETEKRMGSMKKAIAFALAAMTAVFAFTACTAGAAGNNSESTAAGGADGAEVGPGVAPQVPADSVRDHGHCLAVDL